MPLRPIRRRRRLAEGQVALSLRQNSRSRLSLADWRPGLAIWRRRRGKEGVRLPSGLVKRHLGRSSGLAARSGDGRRRANCGLRAEGRRGRQRRGCRSRLDGEVKELGPKQRHATLCARAASYRASLLRFRPSSRFSPSASGLGCGASFSRCRYQRLIKNKMDSIQRRTNIERLKLGPSESLALLAAFP